MSFSSPDHSRSKFLLPVIVLVVIFGILFGGHDWIEHTQQQAMANYRPPPTPVETATATLRRWTPYLTAVGTLQAQQRSVVKTEVPGIISKIAFTPGQRVSKGDLLLQINDDVDRAILKNSQAAVVLAQIIRDQDKKLLATQAISQTTMDQAQASYAEAVATVEQNEAVLVKKQILAPIDGVVDITLMHLGDYLNVGDTITTVSDNSGLYLDFTLPDQDYGKLFTGQLVAIKSSAYPDETFDARIKTIDTQANPKSRSVAVRATLRNPGSRLLPGMFVDLQVMARKAQPVVVLPRTAVTGSLYGNTVFIIQTGPNGEKMAKSVLVSVGDVVGNDIIITSGIDAGQEVVATGQNRLQTGQMVSIKGEAGKNSQGESKP